MKIKDPKVRQLFDHLSAKAQLAFKNEYLIANDVLCKVDTPPVDLLETWLAGRETPRLSWCFCLKKWLRYHVRSFAWFLSYLVLHGVHQFSRQKQTLPKGEELVLIDVYFVFQKILQEKDYRDHFLPGLREVLQQRGKNYAYAPKFYGSLRPTDWYRVFKILRKSRTAAITEFQGLSCRDYWQMLCFVLGYPREVLRFMKTLGVSRQDQLLRHALWVAFDRVALRHYVRYLFGKRLARSGVSSICCISWYENKSGEKNFYRGLRSVAGKSRIYGAHLFVWPESMLNLHPDANEIEFDLVPDRILFNGPYYLPEPSHLNCSVGPSLRSVHIFDSTSTTSADGKIVLVVLPYMDELIRYILPLIPQVDWPAPVLVKFHPSVDASAYRDLIAGNVRISEKNPNELLMKARLVVGQSTGVLVEAASLGIPVIVTESPDQFSHHYMPEFGKGIIWDTAHDVASIAKCVSYFEILLRDDSEAINRAAMQLREQCFCRPDSEKIVEAFNLV